MQYKSHQKIAELLFADAVKKAGGREVRVVRVSGDAHNLRIQQDGVQPEQLDTHLSQFEREEHEKFLHRAKTLFLEISSRLDGAVTREIFEEVISGRTRAKSYPKDFDEPYWFTCLQQISQPKLQSLRARMGSSDRKRR
jgi:hypothetical protein